MKIHLRLTEKWGGSWRREIQCHGCTRPARVLHVIGDSALCRRCAPQLTPQQRNKNRANWAREDALLNELVRKMNVPANETQRRQRTLAKTLRANTTRAARFVLDEAASLIAAVDALPEFSNEVQR